MRIRTKGYQGEIRKRARIFTNDPSKKVELIGIRAFIKAPIYLSPKYVYLRGPASQKVTRTVRVRAGENRPLKLEESHFNLSNKLTYTIEEVEPGRFFRIHFTSIPGAPGNYRGVLKLKTNYPEKPLLTIRIMAKLQGAGKVKTRKKN